MKFLETEKIELKRSLNDSFEKEIVAFLNSNDGFIYLGIEDDGKIIGVEKLDEIMRKISDIVTTSILPNPQELIKVKALYENGKFIIEVEIKKGKSLYYIKKYGRSSRGCYIRMGTSCRSMTEEQIEKKYIETLISSYSLVKEKSPKQKLTFRVFKIYLDENNVYYDEENFNENNHLLTESGEYNYQAFLLSDQCDLSFKVACWDGENKLSNYLYKKNFGGCCILKAMDDLSSYVETAHNKVRSYFDKGTLNRRDECLFDFNAFREAWVNACLHNDYSKHIAPSIYLFNNHMEIISYGSPLKVQTMESFFKGISKPINPELATIFMKIGTVEESGKGVNTIINKYGKEVFVFTGDDLLINIPYNNKALEEKNKSKNKKQSSQEITQENTQEITQENTREDELVDGSTKGKEIQDLILMVIKQKSKVTRRDIAIKLNTSPDRIKYYLEIMSKKGIIKHVGSTKSGYWIII